VQFARSLGARQVVATVSGAQKAELALAAGADAAVDRQLPDLPARLREASDGEGFDRIIEVDMAANGELDAGLVRAGGDVVFYGSGAGAFTVPFFPLIVGNISLHGFIVYNLGAADRQRAVTLLNTLLARGGVQHQIAARLPLADIAAAHELVESGRAVGNVVLAVP
jgi:NADPH2:quinone reductase